MEGKDLAEIMKQGQDKLKSCVSAAPGNIVSLLWIFSINSEY